MFKMQVCHYNDYNIVIPISRVSGPGVCTVRTVDTVPTSEVNCYNGIVRSARGIVMKRNDH